MTSLESKISKRLSFWIPFFHAAAAGLLSALALIVFAPFFLGDTAGHRYLLVEVTICLFVASFTNHAETIFGSVLCGLLFVLPIALPCLLATSFLGITFDSDQMKGLRLFGLSLCLASPVMMMFIGRLHASSRQDNA